MLVELPISVGSTSMSPWGSLGPTFFMTFIRCPITGSGVKEGALGKIHIRLLQKMGEWGSQRQMHLQKGVKG